MSSIHTHSLPHSLSHTLTLSHTHSFTHSLPHTLTLSHTHSLTHPHTHTLILSHTCTFAHSHNHTHNTYVSLTGTQVLQPPFIKAPQPPLPTQGDWSDLHQAWKQFCPCNVAGHRCAGLDLCDKTHICNQAKSQQRILRGNNGAAVAP